MASSIHIRVDPLICQGTGYCARIAPDVFEVEGRTARVKQPHPPEAMSELMEEAATVCPSRAITC